MDISFDSHVHIGQYKSDYFSAKYVFSALKAKEKIGCNFMSTSSCAPLHLDNAKEILSLYEKVRDEVKNALYVAKEMKFDARAYYWIVPLCHFYGITFEQVFSDLPEYHGLKIHPLSHIWNPKIPERANLLVKAFEFAEKRSIPIILHTGNSKEDNPRLYERWFKSFRNVNVTLAHCKNLKAILHLFKKYPQLNGDTAFMPKENFDLLVQHGYENRLVYGSDFPIGVSQNDTPIV